MSIRANHLALCLLSTLCAIDARAEAPWDQILGPTQAKLPAARAALAEAVQVVTFHLSTAASRVKWETDLSKALEQAKAEGRPVFVTMRCLPCKSCSDFDKDVLEGGDDLDPLLLQFVTVRLTSAKDVDMRLLPMGRFEDMDTSWWGWLLSPEGRIYGVFGGRDASGDAGRTSKKALIATLKRVLDHHYDPRRSTWNIDGPLPKLDGDPATPATLPGYQNWLGKGHKGEALKKQECMHCHEVQEILHQTAIDAKTFDKKTDLEIWPLPENTGITLDRDDGLRVKMVKDGTAAAKAGIKAGDRLGGASGRRLFSQADFRAALHQTPKKGPASIEVIWLRGDQVMKGALELADGWRKSNNMWRVSLAEGVIGSAPGFWPLDGGKYREKLGLAGDAMSVAPYYGKDPQGPAFAAGLRAEDVITAVNGQSPNFAGRQWLVWFRLTFEKGEEIKMSVVDAKGEKKMIAYRP